MTPVPPNPCHDSMQPSAFSMNDFLIPSLHRVENTHVEVNSQDRELALFQPPTPAGHIATIGTTSALMTQYRPTRPLWGSLKTTMVALVLYGLAKPCNAAAEGGVRERGQTGKRAEEGGLSTSNAPQRQHVRRHGETIMPHSDPPIYSPAGTAEIAVEVPDYRILASGDIPGSPERGNGSISLPTLDVSFLHQHALTKGPGPLALAGNKKNLYAMTAEALLAFSVDPGSGTMEQIQDLQNGVVDRNGKTVEYFTGLTALALSPDEENVYTVGTSMMPGVGGITVLKRDARGELALVQQLRVDQRKGIVDVEGMIGANSVAPSPDGRFIYVSSGGYYRDHHLLVFDREPVAGRLSLLQSIDIYNTSAARVLPSTLAVAPDGKHVYVIGDNFAISTSAIMVYAVGEDGALELKQEAGPFRSALLTSASFAPSGEFLYCTATFGTASVWLSPSVFPLSFPPPVPPPAYNPTPPRSPPDLCPHPSQAST